MAENTFADTTEVLLAPAPLLGNRCNNRVYYVPLLKQIRCDDVDYDGRDRKAGLESQAE
jgi:hypothetical protein